MSQKRKRFDYATEVLAQPAIASQSELPFQPRLPSQTELTGEIEVLSQPAEIAIRNPDALALPAQRRGKRAEDGITKRTDVPREQLNVRVRPELKRAAAGLAGLQGKTLGDVVEAALIEYLKASQRAGG